jgi:hypothetical protein
VSEGEIMKLCGWRTRSMFDRYNIIDEADLCRRGGEAVRERQTNGKHDAFHACAEFCKFQPQQSLGP